MQNFGADVDNALWVMPQDPAQAPGPAAAARGLGAAPGFAHAADGPQAQGNGPMLQESSEGSLVQHEDAEDHVEPLKFRRGDVLQKLQEAVRTGVLDRSIRSTVVARIDSERARNALPAEAVLQWQALQHSSRAEQCQWLLDFASGTFSLQNVRAVASERTTRKASEEQDDGVLVGEEGDIMAYYNAWGNEGATQFVQEKIAGAISKRVNSKGKMEYTIALPRMIHKRMGVTEERVAEIGGDMDEGSMGYAHAALTGRRDGAQVHAPVGASMSSEHPLPKANAKSKAKGKGKAPATKEQAGNDAAAKGEGAAASGKAPSADQTCRQVSGALKRLNDVKSKLDNLSDADRGHMAMAAAKDVEELMNQLKNHRQRLETGDDGGLEELRGLLNTKVAMVCKCARTQLPNKGS